MNILFLLKPKKSVSYLYDDDTVRQGLEKMRGYSYTAAPVISHEEIGRASCRERVCLYV